MALWTAVDKQHLVFVPEHCVVNGYVLTAPEGTVLETPVVHVARSRWPGILFAFTLLIAILVSTTSVRGPWALFGMAMVTAVVLFNWLELWDPLCRWFNLLRLYRRPQPDPLRMSQRHSPGPQTPVDRGAIADQ